MVPSVLLGLCLWSRIPTIPAVAPPKTEQNPLRLLSREIDSTKQLMEPFQGLFQDLGQQLRALQPTPAEGEPAPVNPAAAALRAASAAVSLASAMPSMAREGPPVSVRTEDPATATLKAASALAAAMPKESVADLPVPEPADLAVLPAAAASAVAEPVAAMAVAEAETPVDPVEKKRLWVLLQSFNPDEQGLMAKLTAPQNLGPKLSQWCNGDSHQHVCRYEKTALQYCQLLRSAAPTLVDMPRLLATAIGILDKEAVVTEAKAPLQLQARSGAGVADDSALWEQVTSSAAFKKSLASACSGLEGVHPACRQVAKGTVYCRALGRAALRLVDSEVLLSKMIEVFANGTAT